MRVSEWRDPDSNRGHHDFQSCALPTELSRRGAKRLALRRPRLGAAGGGRSARPWRSRQPPSQSSKWRWGPVLEPVEPTAAIVRARPRPDAAVTTIEPDLRWAKKSEPAVVGVDDDVVAGAVPLEVDEGDGSGSGATTGVPSAAMRSWPSWMWPLRSAPKRDVLVAPVNGPAIGKIPRRATICVGCGAAAAGPSGAAVADAQRRLAGASAAGGVERACSATAYSPAGQRARATGVRTSSWPQRR